ncbi:MAG: DUF3299 domain-containing protein [Caldimonas sp.]
MQTQRRQFILNFIAVSSSLTVGSVLGAPTIAPVRGSPALTASAFRGLKWAELIPKGWDPSASFRGRNTTLLNDWDPRARKLLKEAKAVWDHAPTVDTFNGASIKIAGYVVPLESSNGALKEFLLVPYFGACIHTPPPPANQIIFVVPKTPAEGFHTMDTVWVSGTLTATRVDTFAGNSGYKIDATAVERYVGAPTY